MQLSAHPDYPGHEGFRKKPRNVRVKVFLDGKEVKYAIAADDVAGLVICLTFNSPGNIVFHKTLRGRVKIDLVTTYESLTGED